MVTRNFREIFVSRVENFGKISGCGYWPLNFSDPLTHSSCEISGSLGREVGACLRYTHPCTHTHTHTQTRTQPHTHTHTHARAHTGAKTEADHRATQHREELAAKRQYAAQVTLAFLCQVLTLFLHCCYTIVTLLLCYRCAVLALFLHCCCNELILKNIAGGRNGGRLAVSAGNGKHANTHTRTHTHTYTHTYTHTHTHTNTHTHTHTHTHIHTHTHTHTHSHAHTGRE
jgi:hypothetical protein